MLNPVTVRVTVVVFTVLPEVPVTVIGYVPDAVVESTVKVRSELPEPGAAMGFVPNPADAPVGRPDADKVMAPLKPFKAAVLIVDVPVLPWATETVVGEAEMLKFGTDQGVDQGGPIHAPPAGHQIVARNRRVAAAGSAGDVMEVGRYTGPHVNRIKGRINEAERG